MIPIQAPTVSVLMSVYNGQAFLSDALAGLRNQTFTDFELIIIDDASTDATPALLADAAAHDPRIRILRNPRNLMLVQSLNRGLAAARGRYIARQDADDISLPHRLEQQVRYLDRNPEVGAVSGRFHRIERGWLYPGENIPVHLGPEAMMPWHLCLGYCAQHSISMFRAGVVTSYLENRLHAEDYDFWARLLQCSGISVLPEVIAYVRLHDTNITRIRAAEVTAASHHVQRDLYHWLTGVWLSDSAVADLRAFGNGHFADLKDTETLDETLLRLQMACAELMPRGHAYTSRQLCRHYLHWLAISLAAKDPYRSAGLIRRAGRCGLASLLGGFLDLMALQMFPRVFSLLARKRLR